MSDDLFSTAVNQAVGCPYEDGARGPDAYDCIGLVLALARAGGHSLPDMQTPDPHDAARVATEFHTHLRPLQHEPPARGDLVVFAEPLAGLFSHAGICLGDGRFIHATRRFGVVAESLDAGRRAEVRREYFRIVQ